MQYNNAAKLSNGFMVLRRFEGNTWVSSHAAQMNDADTTHGGGAKTLSATLDRVRLTRSGTNTFDAGSVSLQYRG